MPKSDVNIPEYIKTNQYFLDGYKWYKSQYVFPLVERTTMLIIFTVLSILLLTMCINIYMLLPIKKQLEYIISVDPSFMGSASIIPANAFPENALRSIFKILIENYVVQREGYDYNNLPEQLQYVKNKSTRVVFNKFYNYLSLENYQSPLLRYQKLARRKIDISSTNFINDYKVEVYFNSIASEDNGNVIENMDWKAEISFNSIKKIETELADSSELEFYVTDYKVTLLRDNNAQKN